ncbi:YybH family protein [Acaryochloris marina NIES-2412]|uniref:YybH family protein n=1 Tax=Acaryochloris marina TaxID=155978 RepID=UPI004059F551
MNDIEKLKATLDEWNAALDSGDIERLAATCDPDLIICNEHSPTSIGLQALRDKYAPRLEALTFKSDVEINEIKIFGDFAIMVTHFDVKTTHKETGEQGGGAGRLVIGYRRDDNGDWKMALDVDNNG